MYIPKIGLQVPRHNFRLSQKLCRFFLKIAGWHFEGELPDCDKFVVIFAPHTSNWDALYGFAAVLAIGIEISWMAKDSAFRWPFAQLFMALGGIPINRNTSHGIVGQMIDEFSKQRQLVLAVTPEGTRSKVAKWKTGFYIIAEQAKVPIVTSFLDYSRKCAGFGPHIYASGNPDADMNKIEEFYTNITGKHPDNYNPNIL